MKNTNLLILFIPLFFLFFACKNKEINLVKESEGFQITKQQFSINEMQLGKIETRGFEKTEKINGRVVAQPNGYAKINAPISGVIVKMNCHNGQFVQKNQVLLEIGGTVIIDLQKDFGVASAHFKRLKSEYERIKILYDEKIASEKEFIMAESEYKAALVQYNSLKMKIISIGFSPNNVENGQFYSSYTLKAPIEGYVSNLQGVIGQNVSLENNLLDIINPELFQIKLFVFPDQISNIQKRQRVRINLKLEQDPLYAEIKTVGNEVDEVSKAIVCYATYTDQPKTLIVSNMFVDAEVILQTDTVLAVPKSAVIKSDTKHYVFVLENELDDKYLLKKQEITIGREDKDFFEIINSPIQGLIITKNVYHLNVSE